MIRSISDIVDIDQVTPYVDRIIYIEFDAKNDVVNSHATDTIRDEILKPAIAEFITDITGDRDGFPGVSANMVDTYFETVMMRMVTGSECPPENTTDRTKAALDQMSDLMREMLDLTMILDEASDHEQNVFMTM